MTINEYRKKHKRCRTCAHAIGEIGGWICLVKMKKHIGGLKHTEIAGMFCPIYKAQETEENSEQ